MNMSYITHSYSLMELDSCYLLFGYYRGTLPRMKEGKLLYMFASHTYADHCSIGILKLKHPSITWILPGDTTATHPHIWAEAGKRYTVSDLRVRMPTSTNEGVAFLVTTEDNCIYHAGDLSW